MICNIDFREAMEYHTDSGNDITVIYKRVDDADGHYLLAETLGIDRHGRVVSVGRNIGDSKDASICMEMYIMKRDLLIDIIRGCITTGKFRKVKNAIYNSLEEYRVGAFEYKGYLRCINSLESYYKTSMELLDHNIYRLLFLSNRPIFTKTGDEAPARYLKGSSVKNSIIGNGSLIEGSVENSIIFRKVHVGKGAAIKNSIILQGSIIGEGSKLTNIITDKYTEIAPDKELKGDEEIPLVVEKRRSF
ncbi:glucose-1-phosphate adenylyltransferase subunit GlgD [Calorimonas adulescens]|uniref:Glucose-1-phosphate adenylyltransferase subunit GlgD n=1 Tax=Calorimonas adulescens TaxID=2606906 RepID=A0A5D8Q8B8_9THEO|nr:glucose-1-phosphate adenylyltransferase subunit GlgD [Calorimonas adulescens]TZE81015.1 glucose-1-phosphate adenylyltransferase subunit GlgD [Calorimonas adulescens]